MPQNISRNNFEGAIVKAESTECDDLRSWCDWYFQFEVTTSTSSQQVQRRDIGLFLSFLEREYGTVERTA